MALSKALEGSLPAATLDSNKKMGGKCSSITGPRSVSSSGRCGHGSHLSRYLSRIPSTLLTNAVADSFLAGSVVVRPRTAGGTGEGVLDRSGTDALLPRETSGDLRAEVVDPEAIDMLPRRLKSPRTAALVVGEGGSAVTECQVSNRRGMNGKARRTWRQWVRGGL